MSTNSAEIQKVVTDWYRSIERRNVDHIVELMTDDIVGDMPYSPGDFPKRLVGKVTHRDFMSKAVSGYSNISFLNFRYWPMENSNYIGLQCESNFTLNAGNIYANNYFCLFKVVSQKIAHWVEYYNPIIFLNAHGSAEQACEQYGISSLK